MELDERPLCGIQKDSTKQKTRNFYTFQVPVFFSLKVRVLNQDSCNIYSTEKEKFSNNYYGRNVCYFPTNLRKERSNFWFYTRS